MAELAPTLDRSSDPPLAPRSIRPLSVAIVDSGVDGAHSWLQGAKLRYYQVEKRGELFVVVDGESGDASGHGTACAGIIHQMVPEAEIVSVRALSADGRCSRDGLIAALRHCVKERFHVVNLSLGIDVPRTSALRPNDYKSIVDLYEVADAAYTAGVVLVASGPNISSFRTYPGKFKSLVGVGRGSFDNLFGLRSEITEDYEIVAPGNDVLAPALGGGERRWTGTSFACPHVAAHVARIRAARPDISIEAIKVALHELASRPPPPEPDAPA